MSSTTMRTKMKSQRMSARRRTKMNSQRSRAPRCGNGGAASSKISDKLEALKSLIPASGEVVEADQLFEQTADYIVRLRAQVAVLQTLVDFYGSSGAETLVS